MHNASKLKRLAYRLLATTCLTAAGTVTALANSIALTPFTYTSYPGDAIPAGTTLVTGTVDSDVNSVGDFFELTGLTGGASFSSIDLTIDDLSDNGMNVELYSDTPSAETVLLAKTAIGAGGTLTPTGNVPTDGNLYVNITPTNIDEFATNYSVSVAAPGVPEPGTLATLGFGLAGIAATGLRRRRNQKQS